MTSRQKIEFDGPVKNIMRKYFPHCKLNSSGRVFAAEILQEIHTLLIKSFENEYGASKQMDDNSTIRCIDKAVNKLFPADIRRCALAEAHRQLILFQDGQIEYDHISSIQALKSSPEHNRNLESRKRTVFGAFNMAVTKIVATIDSDLKIDTKAKQFLGYHVYKMANEIANRAAQNAAGKSLLDYNDIKNSLPEFLKSNLLSYATREARRSLFNHEQGLQKFKPRKPSISALTPVEPDYFKGMKTGKKYRIDLKDSPTIKGYGPCMFTAGIREIIPGLTRLSPSPKTDGGTKQISELLFSIVNFLTNDVAELSQRKNIKEIDFEHVKESIDGIFPPKLLEQAASSGFSTVESHVEVDQTEYDPISSIQALKSSPEHNRNLESRKRTVFGAFNMAATKIVTTFGPHLKIYNTAKQFLGYHDYKMANEIANRASENAARKSLLDYNDIRDSLPDFLKSDLLPRANSSNASRNLFPHTEGLQTFKPGKPSISALTPVEQDFFKGVKTGKKDLIDLIDTSTIKGYGPCMFTAGIREIITGLTLLSPSPKTDEGTKQISEILFCIVNFLTNDVAELSQRKNIKVIDFEHVKESIDGIFPSKLLEQAASSGFYHVKCYAEGILKYRKRPERTQELVTTQKNKKRKIEPHKESLKNKLELPKIKKKEKLMPKPKIKDKTPKKVEPRYLQIPSKQQPPSIPSTDAKKVVKEKKLNFTKAIIDSLKKFPRNLSVNIGSEATERMNSYLLDICKALITECTSQKSLITAETVRAALENFLPQAISIHAISEDKQKLLLHAASHQSFSTEMQVARAETERGFHGKPEKKYKSNETGNQAAEHIKEDLLEEESEATPKSEESDESVDEPVPDEDIT